jgi:flagellar basal body P-ring formation protein FlgA
MNPARTLRRLAFAALALLPAAALPVAAAEEPLAAARAYLDQEVTQLPGRVEVKLGEIDQRIALAPCEKVEPFLPTGARLWGRAFLGIKCVSGAPWRVTVPVEVRVHAVVPVATRALHPGDAVGDTETELKELEVSNWAPGLLGDLGAVRGRVLARNVAAGQPLRADYFRSAQAITAGDPVRVVLTGRGFEVTLDGKALSAGGVGESVKVLLGTGRTLGGTLKPGRVVEVAL